MMRFHIVKTILYIASIAMAMSQTLLATQQETLKAEPWFLEAVDSPENILVPSSIQKVLIAIVDDGVRVSHRDVKDFIWENPHEIADNYKDDDGNGFVDDVQGWDLSDNNNDVAPPPDKLSEFYHGTHLAGIITQIARKAYGPKASQVIEILPVKCLADTAEKKYLKDGYRGIEYAINAGADIIVCAWGMNRISNDQQQILDRAKRKDILIVASAGNFPQESDQYPAAHTAVMAVAALDKKNNPWENSNYGDFVDLMAPGEDIESAAALSDTATTIRTGTSPATAIVAGAAALVKLQHSDFSAAEIKACLLASADFLNITEPQYASKYGAGKINIAAAVNCDLFNSETPEQNQFYKPNGVLHYNLNHRSKIFWNIQPHGLVKGLRFETLHRQPFTSGGRINFYMDSSEVNKPYKSYLLEDLPESIYIPAKSARVTFENINSTDDLSWTLTYHTETDKASTLYCSGTTAITQPGTLEDTSGPEDYAPGSDCKWLITAPKGKVIRFKFTEFNTEAKTDLLYFFNGTGTHEKIMAIFSGPNLPPELTTWTHQVLVWFVTNKKNQAPGWQATFEFIEPPKTTAHPGYRLQASPYATNKSD